MTNLEKILSRLEPVSSGLLTGLLLSFAQAKGAAWLVGGAVRDLLTGEAPRDFDIAFAADLTPVIKTWARRNAGRWFWLDEGRRQSRVVFVDSGLQFDFSTLRAADINADLRLRDFTVNALALPLTGAAPLSTLIDPLEGQAALKRGLLKGCGPGVFLDDPLRVLKGVRHFAVRGWRADAETARRFVAAAPMLVSVAGERIKSELGKILGSRRVTESVELLQGYGILEQLFPEINTQGLLPQLQHMTARIAQLQAEPRIINRLHQPLEEDISLRSLLFFAALWRRVPQSDESEAALKRFRLSNRCRSILNGLRGGFIAEHALHTAPARVQALQLETFGVDCTELLIATLLNLNSGHFDEIAASYLEAYAKYAEKGQVKQLLDGRRLLALTGLRPGPQVGYWQQRIKQAEIAGEVSDETSAVSWLKEQFSD